MGGFFKWFVAVPLAALVTAVLFLLVANQIAPRPFIYRSADDPNKTVFFDFIECYCGPWITIIEGPPYPDQEDSSNAWTRSDKAVTEAPRVPEDKPAMPVMPKRTGPDEKSLHVCNSSSNGSGSAPVLRIAPPFPKACVEKHGEGVVTVQYDITTEGRVFNVSIVNSTDRCFNRAALKAMSRRRYPAMCDAEDKPVARYDQQATIRFVLED